MDLPLLQEQRRRDLESERLLSHARPRLELRLRKERQLLFTHWKVLLSCSVFLVYFALILFRNLAYYRFRAGPPLKDLGHEIFPEISDHLEVIDIPMYLLFSLLLIVCLGAFHGHDDVVKINNGEEEEEGSQRGVEEKPYFVNALKRMMIVYSTGHFLRACTYLTTSLPGTALHCREGSPSLDPPKNLRECFTRLVAINGNCGDLNFSGHVLLFVMGTLFVDHYGPKMWGYPRFSFFHLASTGTAISLCLIQIMLILSSRHHYTVDVVIALYTTPMLWHVYQKKHIDVKPDSGAIESELARESTWPRYLRVFHCVGSILLIIVVLVALILTLKGNLSWIAG